MNADFEQFQYCQGDPLFYTEPTPARDRSPRFVAPVPDSWFRHESDGWVMHAPDARADIPEQGWKVHVSTTGEGATAVLDATASVCTRHITSLKHLTSTRELFLRNSKNYPREHAGKFITCYPREDDLGAFLDDLEHALTGFVGPYILSDKRWMRAPIYLRYGSFRRLTVPIDGRDIPAIRDPHGTLVPDERGSTFLVPEWAPVPAVLADWVEAYDDDDEPFTPPFTVTEAIKFSNGGGTYRAVTSPTAADAGKGAGAGAGAGATDAATRRLVVKEARPHAGLDAQLRTATERLGTERRALVDLADSGVVPAVVWAGRLWEHEFLAVEEVPGVTLQKWIGRNFPVYGSGEVVEQYYRHVLGLASAVIEAVEAVHARGWAHQDLHPRNVMLRSVSEPSLALIDFEAACALSDEERTQDFGFPGFRSLSPRTPAEIDWFGVHQIVSYLVLPLVNLTELTEDYTAQTLRFATERCVRQGTATSATSSVLREIGDLVDALRRRARLAPARSGSGPSHAAPSQSAPSHAAPLPWTPPVTIGALAEVNASTLAGVRRARALYDSPGSTPIHYEGLSEGTTGLAYGPAGLLLATSAAGRTPEELGLDDLVDATRHTLRSALDDRPLPNASAATGAASRIGLFTGAMGDLVGLAATGHTSEVADYLDASPDLFLRSSSGRVYDGGPGELLGLLHLAAIGIRPATDIDATAEHAATALAATYLADPRTFAPVGEPGKRMANQSRYQDSGLLYGHLGIAWALATAARRYHRADLADAAVAALHNELSRYKAVDGCLQFEQAGRLLPYLATGSAGFGIVLPLLDTAVVAREFGDQVPQLLAATDLDFCSSAGLFNGYAGLVVGTDALRRLLGMPRESTSRIAAGLDVHALSLGGDRVFGGDSEFRLSTDLATGAAGISLALSSLERGRGERPSTRPFPAAMRPTRRLSTTT